MKIKVKNYELLGSWTAFMRDYYPQEKQDGENVVLTCGEYEARRIESGFKPMIISVLKDNLNVQNPSYEIIA